MNLEEWWCVIKIENEQRSALIGFHSSTGCDYISSFFHKGKITSWKKHCKAKFLTALSILENQVTLDDETFSTLEEYTCCLYGSNSRKSTNWGSKSLLRNTNMRKIISTLHCCHLVETQKANWTVYLMKPANTAIVQEPPLQYGGWDVISNIILVNALSWKNC